MKAKALEYQLFLVINYLKGPWRGLMPVRNYSLAFSHRNLGAKAYPNRIIWFKNGLSKNSKNKSTVIIPRKSKLILGLRDKYTCFWMTQTKRFACLILSFVYINKFRYLENLHTFDLQSSNLSDSSLLRKELTGPDLEKHATFRLLKLNKKINDRLEWKSSYGYMGKDTTVSARVSADCPEPEVFRSLFLQQQEDGTRAAKSTSTSKKLSRKFLTDEDISNAGVYGKTYRFGARAELRAPASLTWSNGKINFSFHYNVQC